MSCFETGTTTFCGQDRIWPELWVDARSGTVRHLQNLRRQPGPHDPDQSRRDRKCVGGSFHPKKQIFRDSRCKRPRWIHAMLNSKGLTIWAGRRYFGPEDPAFGQTV